MKEARVRVFSVRRLLLSLVLGFVIPVSYLLMLARLGPGRVKRSQFEILIIPIRWPFSLWLFLTQRPPVGRELIVAFIFLAVCNTALYGTIIYAVLFAVSLVRRKPAALEPPPTLAPFSDAASSG
jgi:hypothetical protein